MRIGACLRLVAALALAVASVSGLDVVPGVISHQGRIQVSGVDFNGTGQFQFALVDNNSGAVLWLHDNNAGPFASNAKPVSTLSLTVSNGLYSVTLGDTNIGMQPIPASIFDYGDVRLRIWFSDGTHVQAVMAPDVRLTTAAYASRAVRVENGVIEGTAIGATTPAAGSFTAVNVTSASNQIVLQSSGIAGTLTWTPSGSAKTIAFPNLSGTVALADVAQAFTAAQTFGSGGSTMTIAANGKVTYAGNARPKRTIALTPVTAVLPASNAATLTQTDLGAPAGFPFKTLDFPQSGSDLAACWQFAVPLAFDGTVTTADVTVYWLATDNSGSVGWTLGTDGRGDGADFTAATALNVFGPTSVATPATVGLIKQSKLTVPTTGWHAGDLAILELIRSAGVVGETTGAAKVVQVKVEYTTAKNSDE